MRSTPHPHLLPRLGAGTHLAVGPHGSVTPTHCLAAGGPWGPPKRGWALWGSGGGECLSRTTWDQPHLLGRWGAFDVERVVGLFLLPGFSTLQDGTRGASQQSHAQHRSSIPGRGCIRVPGPRQAQGAPVSLLVTFDPHGDRDSSKCRDERSEMTPGCGDDHLCFKDVSSGRLREPPEATALQRAELGVRSHGLRAQPARGQENRTSWVEGTPYSRRNIRHGVVGD